MYDIIYGIYPVILGGGCGCGGVRGGSNRVRDFRDNRWYLHRILEYRIYIIHYIINTKIFLYYLYIFTKK